MSDNNPHDPKKNKIIYVMGVVFAIIIGAITQIQTVAEGIEKLDIVNRIERIKESFNESGKLIDKNYISINSATLWENSDINYNTKRYEEIPAGTVIRVIREIKRRPLYLVEYKNIRGYVLSENFILQSEKEKLEKGRLVEISSNLTKGDRNPNWVFPEDMDSYFWFPKGTTIQAKNNTIMTEYDAPRDNANVLSAMATSALSLDVISRWGGDGKWYSVHWNNNRISYVKSSETAEVWPFNIPDEQDKPYLPNSIIFSGPGKFIALKEDSRNPSLYRYYIALSACPADICNYGLLTTEIKFLSTSIQRTVHQVYSGEWGNYYIPMIISLPKKHKDIAEISMYIKKCIKASRKCEDAKVFSNQN